MTKERIKELIPIFQAWIDGKQIQQRASFVDDWRNVDGELIGNASDEYRIAPEPTMRPMTRGEVLYKVTTTPGMVVREDGGEANAGYGWVFKDKIPRFEWAIIDAHGDPIDGWHKFEVEA